MKALLRESFRSLEEIRTDLDVLMEYYNQERTNQEKNCQGRTPMETFRDGKGLYDQMVFHNWFAEGAFKQIILKNSSKNGIFKKLGP